MGVFFEKHIIWVFEKNWVTGLQPLRLRNTGVKIQGVHKYNISLFHLI